MGFDRKYGKVTTEHGDIPDDEPVIVFRGRDIELPVLLDAYMNLCAQHGSPIRHIEIVRESQRQIMKWQTEHHDQVRQPDSERSRAWMKE